MTKETWTIQKLIDWTTQFFKNNRIQNPRLDTEVLLSYNLKLDRLGLYLNYDRPLTEEELSSFKKLIKRRANHEPLQYITGTQEFWSLNFTVAPGVLIPRQETELLVEEVLLEVGSQDSASGDRTQQGKQKPDTLKNAPLHVVDLCAGCGCIAVALAKEFTNSTFYAIDNSGAALKIARLNGEKHKVNERISFISGNLFQPLSDVKGSIDIVVSNPPYVKSGELERLDPEIREFEPLPALDGGEDGLDIIRDIIAKAPEYLKSNGWLFLEIAFDQAPDVQTFIEKSGCYTAPTVVKDLSGNDRVVKARVKA
jgi:release factor glutamine methyltransferase